MEFTTKQMTDVAFYGLLSQQYTADEWSETVDRAVDGVDLSAYADELESVAIEAFYRES